MTVTPFQVTMSVCAEPLTNFSNYRAKPALLNHWLLTAVLACLSIIEKCGFTITGFFSCTRVDRQQHAC